MLKYLSRVSDKNKPLFMFNQKLKTGNSQDIDLDDMVDDKPTKYNMKPKKKRVISDEQKKVLTDRLAYARSF